MVELKKEASELCEELNQGFSSIGIGWKSETTEMLTHFVASPAASEGVTEEQYAIISSTMFAAGANIMGRHPHMHRKGFLSKKHLNNDGLVIPTLTVSREDIEALKGLVPFWQQQLQAYRPETANSVEESHLFKSASKLVF